MIDFYLHEIHYEDGIKQTFDSVCPVKFPDSGFIHITYGEGDEIIVNMAKVITISIKHLSLTQEEYNNRQELLNLRNR